MNIREYLGTNIDTDLITISVSGDDSSKFLQGQLSNDIDNLKDNNYQYSSFSTNQGKVIATMRIFKKDSEYIILTNHDVANFIIEGLKKYILMSKVNIKLIESKCYGVLGENIVNEGKSKLTKNIYNLKKENDNYILNTSSSKCSSYIVVTFSKNVPSFLAESIISDINISKLIDLTNVFPRLNDITRETFIPQVLNMEKHDGINYKKGCYTGQEIVARTHYLGKIKKKLFFCSCESSPLSDESKIYNRDAEVVGELLQGNYINLDKYYFQSIIKINALDAPLFMDEKEITIEES